MKFKETTPNRTRKFQVSLDPSEIKSAITRYVRYHHCDYVDRGGDLVGVFKVQIDASAKGGSRNATVDEAIVTWEETDERT